MSCTIKLSATIPEVDQVKKYLYPTDDFRGGDNWLHGCNLSVCPSGEIIAVSREKRLILLSSKWDSVGSQTQFLITYSGIPDENENITSLLCLPIIAQNQSSNVGPDWICVVLGFDSGCVRFYTDRCNLLFEEHVHNEPIVGLKCQSQQGPRPDVISEFLQEEIHIQYRDTLSIISGASLFPLLWNCRTQLALAQARGEPFQIPETSVNPKKWKFQYQSTINDVAVVGLDLANTFDHLATASLCGGFDTKYRAMPPHNTLIIATGSKPFLGFHYALEGGQQAVLSDVAKAMATKLKSALPGWLTGGRAQPEKPTNLATPMTCRFGLSDLHRTAANVILSPNMKLAAVSDGLGRVLLVDVHRGVVLKMFKGYREAQLAFIQVYDEVKAKHRADRRIALFLVVYSGKMGKIEIFSVQQGMKIVTFAASKNSKLLYMNYGLMGFTSFTKSKYVCQYTCVLVDGDGKIKEISVPFHFCLSEKNSKTVKDIHLFKKLGQYAKTNDCNSLEMRDIISYMGKELSNPATRLQCLELLMSVKDIKLETLLHAVDSLVEVEESCENPDSLDVLRYKSEKLKMLLGFYKVTIEANVVKTGNSEISSKFKLRETELKNLQTLLDLNVSNNQKSKTKVTFFDFDEYTLSQFLTIFNLNKTNITVNYNTDQTAILKASELIFKQFIFENCNNFETIKNQLIESSFEIKDTFWLLLYFWMHRSWHLSTNLDREMNNLSSIMYEIIQLMDPKLINVEYNELSEFWCEVRDFLKKSSESLPALTAALVCRYVSQKCNQEQSDNEDTMEIWEKLTQENCEWNILIGKLEDVSLLNIILSYKSCGESNMIKLEQNIENVSLNYILEKGRGSVSELVGKWLTSVGISPEELIENNPNETEVFTYLNLIRNEFPYSTETNTLLTNMCWEYILNWSKQIDDMDYLEAALKCLHFISIKEIKSGLSSLIWNTNLKIIFETCCKLINKVGKLPKSRLCEQDTKLTDEKLCKFLETTTNFLDELMNTLNDPNPTQQKPTQYEPLFDENPGSLPLIELAQQQNEINYDLVLLHYQLSLTMLMMATFEIKHAKPIANLFDGTNVRHLFAEMQSEAKLSWSKSQGKVSQSQVSFLKKVISASIETITDTTNATKHVFWMSRCVSLGRLWGVDVEVLKRYQVVELFSADWDGLALEMLPGVGDCKELGPPLVAVAGKRLKHYLASCKDLGESMAALSPSLTRYLETLTDEWSSSKNLEDIKIIVTHSLVCLSKDQFEYKMAGLMLDACEILQTLPNVNPSK